MLSSVILYIANTESEIPQQIMPNSAYYIVGKEIRLVDGMGQTKIFVPQSDNAESHIESPNLDLTSRVEKCESQLSTIITHLSGFKI